MATYNLFLNASQADNAITNAYRLFQPDGLTGENISLYGGNINHWGAINSTQINITGDIGEESFINRLTGGIRVAGDCEIDKIIGGVQIYGTSHIESLTGGLIVSAGGAAVVGGLGNAGTFRNTGAAIINGATTITGATRIVGNTEILGNFYQSGLFDVISNDAEFRGNIDISGTLDVFGRTNIVGQTLINAGNSGLTVQGPTTVNGNTTINGTTNVVGTFLVNGQVPVTHQTTEITEVNYFLTGGECVEALTGFGGDVILTSNTGLIVKKQNTPIIGAARGDYSVDLQMERSFSGQVAAGDWSALIGGHANTASGQASAVIGGFGNKIESSCYQAVIVGGSNNSIKKDNYWSQSYGCSILGGYGNSIEGTIKYASIIGGTYGRAYNDGERVLSHRGEFNQLIQVGELVLSLTNGVFVNRSNGISINSGIAIPPGTMIAFKGIGGLSYGQDQTFVELKGIASRAGFNLSRTYSFGGISSNITGVVTTDIGDPSYASFSLYDLTALNAVDGNIYLELVYVPINPDTTNGPIAFNSDPDLDTLFS